MFGLLKRNHKKGNQEPGDTRSEDRLEEPECSPMEERLGERGCVPVDPEPEHDEYAFDTPSDESKEEIDKAEKDIANRSLKRILVFCDQSVYYMMKDRVDFRDAIPIVFFPDHEYDSNMVEKFCQLTGYSTDCVVPIDECYFARYRSPMRGSEQGPALPPMPVLDKLRVRLYPPNASRIFEALCKAVTLINGDVCDVDIYTNSICNGGFFIDAALLADGALSARPKVRAHMHLHVFLDSGYYYQDNMRLKYRKAILEEIDYMMRPDLPESVRRIRIGEYDTMLRPDLFESCSVLTDDVETDFAAAFEQYGNMPIEERFVFGEWPYFCECKWNEIAYRGFVPDPLVVDSIRGFAGASRDCGLHLYRQGDDHWML